MDQRFIINIEFEPETAFTLHSLQRPGGSTSSMGKFIDPKTGEYWLGKSEVGYQEEDSKLSACKEKIANDIYGYFGIRVPRLRISYQSLAIEDQDALQTYQKALRGTHAWHVMSRWLDRFDSYGYLPTFAEGDIHELSVMVEGKTRRLPERGLGAILAVAHWLNDIDVMSPSGGNVGYQLQLDEKGQLYAQSCKIDPGYAFHEVEKSESYHITDSIRIATQCPKDRPGSNFVRVSDLSQYTQQEYFLTMKKIAAISDQQVANFFAHPNTQQVLGNVLHLIQCLKSRRNELIKLHEIALKTVQEMVSITTPTTIPPILQRLYCQAKLQYETDVREKAAFYVPLDVTVSPHSEERISIQTLWENFLGIRSSLSLTTQATTTAASTTASTAVSSSASSTTASTNSNVLVIQPLTERKIVLLLLGASGSGKSLSTQLLVEHCWQAFLQNPQNRPIPLRIELKQFSERTVGQCIINTLLDEYRYNPADIHLLQQYPFVFILDGYDELAGQAKINLLQKHQATESQYGPWQAQFIISCRDSYFQGLDQSVFYPPQGLSGLDIRYLSPLTPAHQIDYLMRYKESVKKTLPKKTLPDYKALLTEHPHLHELLGNPFLLRIFRDALPQWQADHPEASLKDLTRYDLYTAFMKHWFASEALRLSMIQAKYLPDNLPERFFDFSLRLAFTMHMKKVDEVNIEEEDQKTWESFFNEQDEKIREARAGCPLRRIGQSRYSFVHKSFLEYFVARCLWEALANQDLTTWNQRLLPETREILQFLVEHWKQASNPILKDRLWSWVQGSRTNDQQNIAAANAITVLNHGGLAFIGEYGDLANVKIPGADLQNALLDHACLRAANLRGVNLSRAFLRGTDLTQADLMEIQLGELPSLKFNHEIMAVVYSYDGRWLAVAVGNNIEFWKGDGSEKMTTLKGHTGDVISMAFDPTDSRVVSINGRISEETDNNTFRRWNAQSSNALTALLQGHAHEVTRRAFDSTNTRILSGSKDKTLRFWDAQSGKLLLTLQGHTHEITSCAFDPTGTRILSGSKDKTLRLWDAQSGRLLITLQGHAREVTSCAFDSTGTHIVSASYDCTVRIWEADSGKLLNMLQGHTNHVTSCAFDPTGTRLVSGSYDKTLRLWHTQSGKLIATLKGHSGCVTSCAFDPTGTRILSGSYDKTLRLWDTQSGKSIATLEGHTSSVNCIAFDPAGKHNVVSGSKDQTLRLWNVQSGQSIATLPGHTHFVTSVAFDPASTRIVSGSWDQTLRLWDVQSGQLISIIEGHTSSINRVAFDHNGMRIISESCDQTLRLWDVQSGQLITKLNGVAFDPTGMHIVSINWDLTHNLCLWEAKNKKLITTLRGHHYSITGVAFDMTGKRIISTSEDKTLRLWDVQTGHPIAILKGHTKAITSAAFDPTGMHIASGSDDNTLRLWEVQSGKHIHKRPRDYNAILVLEGHTNSVTSVTFDPTGMRIVSGSYDNTLRIWRTQSGQLITILQGHTGGVTSVAFAPFGERIVSGSNDKSILLWCSVNAEGTAWQVIWRAVRNPVLYAPNAFLHQATLSLANKNVLIQHGATQVAPEYTDYRQSFWSTPQDDKQNFVATFSSHLNNEESSKTYQGCLPM